MATGANLQQLPSWKVPTSESRLGRVVFVQTGLLTDDALSMMKYGISSYTSSPKLSPPDSPVESEEVRSNIH